MERTRRERAVLLGSIALVALAVLFLVLASPLALPVLDHREGRDWGRLSDIGQTYGAVSALLSAFALGGVVVSLVLQRRSVELDREDRLRTAHRELVKLALDDPDLFEVIGRQFLLMVDERWHVATARMASQASE